MIGESDYNILDGWEQYETKVTTSLMGSNRRIQKYKNGALLVWAENPNSHGISHVQLLRHPDHPKNDSDNVHILEMITVSTMDEAQERVTKFMENAEEYDQGDAAGVNARSASSGGATEVEVDTGEDVAPWEEKESTDGQSEEDADNAPPWETSNDISGDTNEDTNKDAPWE